MLLVLIRTAMLVFAESFSNYNTISVLVAVTQFQADFSVRELTGFYYFNCDFWSSQLTVFLCFLA